MNQTRKNIISFRVSDEEIQRIDKLKKNLSYNEYCREKILGKKAQSFNPYTVDLSKAIGE